MRYADAFCKITRAANEYVITGEDRFSGQQVTVRVPAHEMFAYRQGGYIQEAMPSVGESEREFLLSGMYDSFPEDEDC